MTELSDVQPAPEGTQFIRVRPEGGILAIVKTPQGDDAVDFHASFSNLQGAFIELTNQCRQMGETMNLLIADHNKLIGDIHTLHKGLRDMGNVDIGGLRAQIEQMRASLPNTDHITAQVREALDTAQKLAIKVSGMENAPKP